MMRFELGLLTLATLLALPACDKNGPDSGDPIVADDEDPTEGEDTEGETDGEEETEGETDGEEETEGAEAEPEACNLEAQSRQCDAEGEAGVQYCAGPSDDLLWGPCLANPECVPGDRELCFEEDSKFGEIWRNCYLGGNGEPRWEDDACNTPLVLSFEPGPVQMTAASSASFDITGAGECVTTDWPAAQNPWLAIDLDKSGAIEGGHELFGSGTVLPSGMHASNGFAALSQLDSNGDGTISALDERFDELVLWSDHDGDRQSTLWELQPLSQRGVSSIALSATTGRECDARGNCAKERSAFSFAADGGAMATGQVVDIYLSCQ